MYGNVGMTFCMHHQPDEIWPPNPSFMVQVQLLLLWRLGEFHIDDGSGPWLRDRILITASEAEDRALPLPEGDGCDLLQGTGLVAVTTVEAPPADEWELARRGTLHREVGDCKL